MTAREIRVIRKACSETCIKKMLAANEMIEDREIISLQNIVAEKKQCFFLVISA